MKNPFYRLRYNGLQIFIISLLLTAVSTCATAQKTDSAATKNYRNSIKLNLTSQYLYDNVFQMSYERLIGKKQSLGIFGGYNEFPISAELDVSSAKLGKTKNSSGYSFGADYRFYLAKENKYPTPHGVYLGPFVSYYHFNSDKTLTDSVGSQSTTLSTNINFLGIGGELGYQFVLGKKERWVIDAVVVGPAYTFYKFKAIIQSNLNGVDEGEVIEKIIEKLKERLPLFDQLTKEEGVNSSGVQKFWGYGFRYSISVGFRF